MAELSDKLFKQEPGFMLRHPLASKIVDYTAKLAIMFVTMYALTSQIARFAEQASRYYERKSPEEIFRADSLSATRHNLDSLVQIYQSPMKIDIDTLNPYSKPAK